MRKKVRDLRKSLDRLRRKLRAQGASIARGLASRPVAPPGAAGLYRQVLAHLEAELQTVETDLVAAEDAYVLAKERPYRPRRRRDRAAASLYELHRPLRGLLAAFPQIDVAGFPTKTPKDPHALELQAGWTVDFLRRLEADPPPPSRGLRIEPGVVAGQLEGWRLELEGALSELEVAEVELRGARVEVEGAIGRVEEVGPWVRGVVEGLGGLGKVRSVGVRVVSG